MAEIGHRQRRAMPQAADAAGFSRPGDAIERHDATVLGDGVDTVARQQALAARIVRATLTARR